MSDTSVKSINCSTCGAGLNVYGGGRVRTHVCGYCGSELDPNRNYEALSKFAEVRRPKTPFEIGMDVELFGVQFKIIGTLGVVEKWGGRSWPWVEHQVYSPTHGYAWLNFESGGHLTFTRKIRSRPSPNFITGHSVNQAEMRPTALMDGRNYTYYDSGNRQIEFAEGEFNWRPKAGEVSSSVSLASGDLMLTYVQTPSEREIEQTRYVDPEAVYASAGVSPKWRRGVHILQEYKPTAGEALRSVVAGACAVLCFVLVGTFSSNEAQVLKRQEASFQQFPVETAFEVTQPDALVRVSIWSNVNNSWAEFDVELEDPEDEVLFETSRGVEFYQGYDGGSWSEGSTTTRLTFRPTVAGQYTLTFSSPVSQVDWKGGRPANRLRFSVFENVYPTFWLSYAALLLIFLAAIPILRRLLHQRRRWSGSDWEDDE